MSVSDEHYSIIALAVTIISTACIVPRPGFPLYQVIAESHGASVVHYDLLPDKGWECDLDHLESILKTHGNGDGGGDDRPAFAAQPSSSNTIINNNKVVRGILVNNPSNPTGAVYSKEHLLQIIKLAEKYRVPIIADEIYGDMTFGSGKAFCPMANVAASVGYTVPIITASGLGKQCECRHFSCVPIISKPCSSHSDYAFMLLSSQTLFQGGGWVGLSSRIIVVAQSKM